MLSIKIKNCQILSIYLIFTRFNESFLKHLSFMDNSPDVHKFENYFNWTMTYRLDSTFPIPYGHFIQVRAKSHYSCLKKAFLINRKKRLLLPMILRASSISLAVTMPTWPPGPSTEATPSPSYPTAGASAAGRRSSSNSKSEH